MSPLERLAATVGAAPLSARRRVANSVRPLLAASLTDSTVARVQVFRVYLEALTVHPPTPLAVQAAIAAQEGVPYVPPVCPSLTPSRSLAASYSSSLTHTRTSSV